MARLAKVGVEWSHATSADYTRCAFITTRNQLAMTSSASHPTTTRPELLPGLMSALRMVLDVNKHAGGQEESIRALVVLVKIARGERVD